jgi:hypothetical protein
LRDVIFEIRHYREDGHGLYSIREMDILVSRMFEYLFLVLPSHNPIVSSFISIFTVYGAALLFKKKRAFFISVFLPAIIYLAYFSTQDVMIVRNYLVIWPVMSFLSAAGIVHFARLATYRTRGASAALAAIALPLMLVSFSHFVVASRSLSEPARAEDVRAQLSSLTHAGLEVYVSPGVKALLESSEDASDIVFDEAGARDPAEASAALFRMHEMTDGGATFVSSDSYGRATLANTRGIYTVVSGPRDVDLDYYPTWTGADRIVLAENLVVSTLGDYILPGLYRVD